MLSDKTLRVFLDELASSAPAPGGGSAAAVLGSMGAALVSMVCNLTVGKKKYADVQGDIEAILEQSEGLRLKLLDLMEADVEVYTGVSEAFKMPRGTDEEKATRTAAIQEALKAATLVPLDVAQACVDALALCTPAAEKGNVNAVSDAGVAALAAEAGLRSAALNVLINLGLIKDQGFVDEQQAKLDSLLKDKPALKEEVYALVVSKL
jgi:formiminotetrahydrofolate cyclodeaminase